MDRLNIIGAGRVGRTLGALFEREGVFSIQDVLSGTPQGARSAVAFIGGGHAVGALEVMRAAEVWMLAPPDRKIGAVCSSLAASGLLRAGDVVFHCSGALSSVELQPAAERGATVASVHPVKSFAEPDAAVATFAGICCAVEGDRRAIDALGPKFEGIGARLVEIEPRAKPAYHAASVIVSNYLVALMEAGLRCYERAGIPREDARAMMEPLVRETLDNVLRLGPVKALTGPIARGDHEVVAQQLSVLAEWDTRIEGLYRELGAVALELARQAAQSDAQSYDRIERLLRHRA